MRTLTNLLTCAALAASVLPFGALAQTAASYVGGEVMFVSGGAQRVRPDGSHNAVSKGMELLEGDRIKTQADSHVYVRLRDGGLLVVRPASELHVDLWRFDPARPQDSRIRYTLDNGVARHVSGQAAKAARDKFRFNTPMAAIGVRGTDFTVLADPDATRVSVQSGGVIVSSLSNGCSAQGLGPCEGASAVELLASASKDKLLQLRVGEQRAELIDDSSANPAAARAVAGGEPSARQKNIRNLDVAESRTSEFIGTANHIQPEAGSTVVSSIAAWGRWAGIAENGPGLISSEDVMAGRSTVSINQLYVLSAKKQDTAFELPGAGIGSFKLATHEGVIADNLTGRNVATTASDSSLRIDFGNKLFETSMLVKAGELAAEIKGKGSVESDGRFVSDITSPSFVQGLVGGKQAAEAVYLYKRTINDRYDATGIASWRK